MWFEEGLRQYTKFILSFCLRDNEFKKTKIINIITHFRNFRLFNDSFKQEGEIMNDLELVPNQ
jgi:hypothetical protein